MNNQTFKLFADCFSVSGYKRGVMYDLNRKNYQFIPNSMIDFINEADGKSKEEIILDYTEEYHETVNQYFNFFENNEFAFFIDASIASNFIKLNLDWDYPAKISNAIIAIDEQSDYDIVDTLKQLENLGCKHIQLKSYAIKPISFYNEILHGFINSSYLAIEIITLYDELKDELEIKKFVLDHKRVKAIVFHTAPFNKIINDTQLSSMGNIAFTSQNIKSTSNNNSRYYFNVSVELFTEAQQHHTYFNRKVSIDVNGEIKNCTTHNKIFGNVKTDKIADVIALSEFQKLWFVSKDKTLVCKDCENRYMCVDSRIPKQISDTEWSHDVECNYNPYIAKWKGEDGYITRNEFQNATNEN
jgi:SPASM domain peptide maturase of grasp-with-spasm system